MMLLPLVLSLGLAHADYAQCTPANSYFEEELVVGDAMGDAIQCGAPDEVPENFAQLEQLGGSLELPPACVLASQSSTPENVYRFGACGPGRTMVVTSKIPKPCISERYHFFTYVSYRQAMRCLGIDPRELFGLINLESNFQINIGSSSGAWGVGQLTGIAVQTINQQKRLAPFVDRKECAPVKKYLEQPMSSRNACEWIGAPENPVRNFLYAGASYLAFKNIAAGLVSKAKAFARLKPAERQRLTFDLTAYMYNGGDGGIRQALAVYLAERGDKPVGYAEFREAFRGYLAANYGTSIPYYESRPEALAAKRREVSMYVAGIDARLKKVEKSAGVKCSL